jgi:hypothetical protein
MLQLLQGHVSSKDAHEMMMLMVMPCYDHAQIMHRCKANTWGVIELAMPAFLQWSRSPITFDWTDHPDSIPHPGRYPLMVDPIVGMKRLTKVLMGGGSGLNILYIETLDAMGINRSRIWLTGASFHGVILGKQTKPVTEPTKL